MITTPALIDALSTNVTPVRRLRPPVARAVGWLVLAFALLALLAVSQGIRPHLADRLHDPAFVVALVASLCTGMLAAVAAFLTSLPDRSRLWSFLPMPTLVVWMSTLGYQCLADWVSIGPGGVSLGETARCFATLVLTGVPLSLAMLVMLRHVAPLRPTIGAMMGGLAVAAMTTAAMSLFHTVDATAMILMWNLGTTALCVGLAAALSRRSLS